MENKKTYINQMQLVHIFAQGKQKTTLHSSSYKMKIEDNILYYNKERIAYIYSSRQKIAIVLDDLDAGSELSTYRIVNAFSKEWTVFKINKLYNLDKSNIYINILKTAMINRVCELGKYERLLNDKVRRYSPVNNSNNYNETIKLIIDKLGNKKRILNKQFNISGYYITYNGWNAVYNYISRTISAIEISEDKVYTEKEWNTIHFKQWVYNNILSNKVTDEYPKSKRREIYDDLIKRKEVEDKIRYDIAVRINKLNELTLIKAKEQLVKWLNGETRYTYSLYELPIHLRIKNDNVETTQNANVPINHAKRLFKYFMSCVDTNTEFKANEKSISVGMFTCTRIAKDELDNWYLIAGCHKIYKREIDLFIDTFKPEWRIDDNRG